MRTRDVRVCVWHTLALLRRWVLLVRVSIHQLTSAMNYSHSLCVWYVESISRSVNDGSTVTHTRMDFLFSVYDRCRRSAYKLRTFGFLHLTAARFAIENISFAAIDLTASARSAHM